MSTSEETQDEPIVPQPENNPEPRFVFELTCHEAGASSYRTKLVGPIKQLELAQHLTAVLAKLMENPDENMIPPHEGGEE